MLGYVFCELQVGNQYVRKATILVARQGVNSIFGTEWLSTLMLEIASRNQDKGELISKSIEKEESDKLCEEIKIIVKEFPKLF